MISCKGCGLPINGLDECGMNLAGEKVDHHGYQAKCVQLLRAEVERLCSEIEQMEAVNNTIARRAAGAELQNGVLLEVARLAYNAEYSHTQYETDIWEKDLQVAIRELPKDIADAILDANRTPTEKRVIEKPKCAALKFIGVARCPKCATEGLLREDGVIEDGRFYTKPIVCEVCKPVKQNCAVLIGDGSECGYALPCPIKGHSEKREELCPKYICPLCYHHINSEEHALCVKERAAHHGLTGE